MVSTVKAMRSQPIRTGFRSPWQNGVAEPEPLLGDGCLRLLCGCPGDRLHPTN